MREMSFGDFWCLCLFTRRKINANSKQPRRFLGIPITIHQIHHVLGVLVLYSILREEYSVPRVR